MRSRENSALESLMLRSCDFADQNHHCFSTHLFSKIYSRWRTLSSLDVMETKYKIEESFLEELSEPAQDGTNRILQRLLTNKCDKEMWSCSKGHQSEKIRKRLQEGGLSAAIRNNHNRFYHAALHNISTHQSTELLTGWWGTVGGRVWVHVQYLRCPWGNRPPAHQVQPHDLKGRAHSCSYAQSGSLAPHASSLSAAPRLMKQ